MLVVELARQRCRSFLFRRQRYGPANGRAEGIVELSSARNCRPAKRCGPNSLRGTATGGRFIRRRDPENATETPLVGTDWLERRFGGERLFAAADRSVSSGAVALFGKARSAVGPTLGATSGATGRMSPRRRAGSAFQTLL